MILQASAPASPVKREICKEGTTRGQADHLYDGCIVYKVGGDRRILKQSARLNPCLFTSCRRSCLRQLQCVTAANANRGQKYWICFNPPLKGIQTPLEGINSSFSSIWWNWQHPAAFLDHLSPFHWRLQTSCSGRPQIGGKWQRQTDAE